jgi:hypothetical protein
MKRVRVEWEKVDQWVLSCSSIEVGNRGVLLNSRMIIDSDAYLTSQKTRRKILNISL